MSPVLTLLLDALQGLSGRFYEGRPIQVEFSPVTDFREATCRQYEENTCTRGGYASSPVLYAPLVGFPSAHGLLLAESQGLPRRVDR
jgi:hypothetical protein